MSLIPNNHERARIIITSLAHNESVSFFPYDFEFDDNYRPDWNSYDAFGRMDPIMTYKRTSREVNVSFNVVAENIVNVVSGNVVNFNTLKQDETAEYNFQELQKLIRFLYPVYDNPLGNAGTMEERRNKIIEKANQVGAKLLSDDLLRLNMETQKQIDAITAEQQNYVDYGVNIIKKSPLVTVSFMNLLNNEQHVAAIINFKHKMKFDSGNTFFTKEGKAVPGEFNINLGLKIIHTSIPGTGELRNNYDYEF